jgi:hypothetical protein
MDIRELGKIKRKMNPEDPSKKGEQNKMFKDSRSLNSKKMGREEQGKGEEKG